MEQFHHSTSQSCHRRQIQKPGSTILIKGYAKFHTEEPLGFFPKFSLNSQNKLQTTVYNITRVKQHFFLKGKKNRRFNITQSLFHNTPYNPGYISQPQYSVFTMTAELDLYEMRLPTSLDWNTLKQMYHKRYHILYESSPP